MDANEFADIMLDLAESAKACEINNSNNNDYLLISSQSQCTTDEDSENTKQNKSDVSFTLDKKAQFEIEIGSDSQNIHSKQNGEVVSNSENENVNVAVINTKRPLCADYRSDSDSDSVDTDNSTSAAEFTSETSSDSENSSEENSESENSGKIKTKREKHKTNTDLSLSDLPPIEELRISVPEDDCIEIGTITSIVETLVIVESYKGTPALDVDTVLFLDCGKRTLGKVFDILGPINEPVYAVRFNNQQHIKDCQIEKGLNVYCAPKSQHTSFLFLSEIIKHKGSDASWKDNIEAPSEFQDFSDDEEERRHKMNKNSNENEDGSRKRPFSKTTNVAQPVRFRPQNIESRPQRPPINEPSLRPLPRLQAFQPIRPFQYSLPHYPGSPVLIGRPHLPHMYFTPRLSGPPFPNFAPQGQMIRQPFHQQRTHAFRINWRQPFVMVPPPPPPPPPPAQSSPSASTSQGSHGGQVWRQSQ